MTILDKNGDKGMVKIAKPGVLTGLQKTKLRF